MEMGYFCSLSRSDLHQVSIFLRMEHFVSGFPDESDAMSSMEAVEDLSHSCVSFGVIFGNTVKSGKSRQFSPMNDEVTFCGIVPSYSLLQGRFQVHI